MISFALSIIKWLKNFHLYNEDGSVNTKEGVDVLKTTIDIPGVARQLMYNSAAAHPGFKGFMLFNESNRDWEDRFRNNIVGGPSVIYSFHHKAGETRLRDPVNGKLCRSVLGLDATALYASRIRKPLPAGPAIRYDPCDPPEGSEADPGPWFQRKMACQMDSRVSMKFLVEQGNPDYGAYPDLKHLYNQGRETKFGPFAVDGVSYDQRTILEYNGCWYHVLIVGLRSPTQHLSKTKTNNTGTGGLRLEPAGWKRELDAMSNKCGVVTQKP